MNSRIVTVARYLALGMLLCWPFAGVQAQSSDAPVETLRAERQAAEARDRARLAELVDDREALEEALETATAERDAARERRETLEARQQQQRERLQELNERRREQGGDLDGVLAVVSRHSGELRDELSDSWLTVGRATLPERLDEQAVLEGEHVESLADRLMTLTAESGRAIRFTAPVADHSGRIAPREVIRLGDFLAFGESDLLHRSGEGEAQRLAVAERTPHDVASRLEAFQQGTGDEVSFDPTHGQVIDALAQQPSLAERFHQGGAVGYVVVTLGVIGLLVALGQYGYLLRVSMMLRRQIRDLDILRDDNPLGRVLARFQALGSDHAPEALEARLDEALLAEQPRLERGQPLVKLLAAVAPLLGLLGTVTGMIVTFQSITVFGTGDPQLMAGGISQALVTTVLGLITAVPLLFAHTALASRSRHLVGVVEGRASAALAEHLEAQRKTSEQRVHDSALA
ncbi:biopolymer transporter TonB [Litchfieldella qijiaojingensis]|uniref:Biopolymer transporter TonB n=1 Tax=Litchfieldella qijiaojingensis TaxID=980347 RepID=A0ABQ2YED3_9GAMM|nr:MotA/TolQ/ExbB proton channel family protein [Halomonas qijiaojingensis]GGX81206.1 biopolymer transporter TonB [Halomonas qijiaojingensis]